MKRDYGSAGAGTPAVPQRFRMPSNTTGLKWRLVTTRTSQDDRMFSNFGLGVNRRKMQNEYLSEGKMRQPDACKK